MQDEKRPPWEIERYRLWSVCDVLRVFPPTWLLAVAKFSEARLAMEQLFSPPEALYSLEQWDDALGQFSAALQDLADRSEEMVLSRTLKLQILRLMTLADEGEKTIEADSRALADRGSELLRNIASELSSQVFLSVPSEQQDFYLDSLGWFGESVVDKFEIERDVRDACQCYALAQWTACVFHSMRVLEIGLRSLAKSLKIQMKARPVDLAEWNDIITAVENAIKQRAVRPTRKLTVTQRKKNDWYAEMATDFRYFKSAWRNHVSHARGDYDEEQADRVLGHVRSFMQVLARGPA